MKTHTLEAAAYYQCRLRMNGYPNAKFYHQRHPTGRPTGRFIVVPGEHTDLPARLLKSPRRKETA